MPGLAETVLPLIRSRSDLHRWGAANAHGRQMREAVAVLEDAAATGDPVNVFAVTQRAIASAVKVILRADDSSGIIGGVIRDLLELHSVLAVKASPSPAKLVEWMIKFQFDGEQDFFEIDPVAYAPALGDKGVARYRARLDEIAAATGPELDHDQEHLVWTRQISDPASWERMINDRHARFVLGWNARRLAVLDHDIEAIIATHARDRKVAAWFEDTAEALEEVGEIELAIDWAKQATDFDRGHQSIKAAGYWCNLLATHRPDDLLPARLEVFRRWPTASHAHQLHRDAGEHWLDHREEIMIKLAGQPREAVAFALRTLEDLELAWNLAHSLQLGDAQLWEQLAEAYATVNPLAVLPIYTELVDNELQVADARHYRSAAGQDA